ncbi:M48 family peptidase [Chroococcidiopsis sp. CCALA 051]|uniref:M48 family metallopeptidase n=1 Tax=Chroococcidiopsis sp. CCALA 051 TaxID=869949 RepID=UPI000D0D0BDE|nr:SprT family zinc-dependent metalloprotease [Chroococcidiopsis sp. CCALA 051]PSM48486.1 M48 family peptidase [Chroococcidiopsis sp. CCALA 051]
MSATTRTIDYGDETIAFEVTFSERKTLDISVHPNRHVTVKAPIDALLEEIDRRVKKRARWILKQQQYFSQFDPRTPSRQYISGETYLYLGRQYRLKVEQHSQPSVKLVGRYIHIQTPQPDRTEITQKIVENWYLDRAKTKFSERLAFCFVPFQRLGCDCPHLQIRRLAKRWGSLTASGTIVLNRDLIRADSRGIDYVITHELCHLKHPNHNRAFYDLLSSIMPDWEERKLKLEQMLG